METLLGVMFPQLVKSSDTQFFAAFLKSRLNGKFTIESIRLFIGMTEGRITHYHRGSKGLYFSLQIIHMCNPDTVRRITLRWMHSSRVIAAINSKLFLLEGNLLCNNLW